MSKQKEPTVEELLAKIKSLEDDLRFEKEFNRKMLKLPPDASNEELTAAQPWSTEWMQRRTDNLTVTAGLVTQVYKQRVFKLLKLQDGGIVISQYNGESLQNNPRGYQKIDHTFTPESYVMLMELMEYSIGAFGIDRKGILDLLTDGKPFVVKKEINYF